MDTLNIVLLKVGAIVLVLPSEPLKRSLLSTPLLALAVGALLGPAATDLLDVTEWGSEEIILEQAVRLTLGVSLMGIALRLPRRFPFENWRPLAVLLRRLPALLALPPLISNLRRRKDALFFGWFGP